MQGAVSGKLWSYAYPCCIFQERFNLLEIVTGKAISSIIIGKDENTVEVFPRKSRLARRIIIRISKKRGVELVIPTRASLKSAIAFLHTKEQWVLDRCAEIQGKNCIKFTETTQISILGDIYTISHSGNLRGVTKIEGENLVVSGLPEHIERKTKKFLMQKAKEEITIRAHIEAEKLGVKFSHITVRDTTSRWGSCSASGNLSFSWRLVLAPRAVMEYVVAHEIAHIMEMSHNSRFWSVVASICPSHAHSRRWLKANGELLHSYGD